MTSPLSIPSFLKHRPRGNSYPSPKDMDFINRIKKPKLPKPPKNKKKSNSIPTITISKPFVTYRKSI
jgi:hypothetical protein